MNDRIKTILFLSLLPLGLSALGSCVSADPPKVDNALLVGLPSTRMASVVDARASRDSAQDLHAASGRDVQLAENQVELARSGLDVTRAQLEDTKLAVVIAKRNGSVADIATTTQAMECALLEADAGRGLLALRKREFEQAGLAEKLAFEESRWWSARVELEKATAVQQVDSIEAKRIPLRDYSKQVRFHEVELAFARARLAAAKSKTDEAREEYDAIEEKVRALEEKQ